MTNTDSERGLTLDILGFILGLVGSLIAIGAVTLHQTRTITALIGLTLLIAARAGLLSFTFTVNGVSQAAFRVWLVIIFAFGGLAAVASINAIVNLLNA